MTCGLFKDGELIAIFQESKYGNMMLHYLQNLACEYKLMPIKDADIEITFYTISKDKKRKAYLDNQISKWPKWKQECGSYDRSLEDMLSDYKESSIKHTKK